VINKDQHGADEKKDNDDPCQKTGVIVIVGRGDRIRTYDLLLPKQAKGLDLVLPTLV